MKFGSFHDDGGLYFASLELEDGSKSDNRVLFFAAGSTDPVLYEGECTSVMYRGSLMVTDSPLCRYSEAKGVVRVYCFGH